MKSKVREQAEARRLRAEYGMPMKEIAARLSVSSSSVYLWTRDIQLTAEQRQRNMRRSRTAFSQTWRNVHRARRREYQEQGRAAARAGDPLHLAGCMLYWAEGSKRRGTVRLTNSDVNMVAFFKRFLTTCFSVEPSDLRLSLHVYTGNGLSVREIEEHWLTALDLPRSCLRKHSLNPLPTSSSGAKRNKLPYGVCTLVVHDTRIAQHIYGAIQEYAGFEEPRWLDGPATRPGTRGGPSVRAGGSRPRRRQPTARRTGRPRRSPRRGGPAGSGGQSRDRPRGS